MSPTAWLTLWAMLFVAQHLGVTSTGMRDRLVDVLGEKAYVGVYAVVSILLLVLLVRAYNGATPAMLLWPTGELLRWVPLLLMPLALLLVVGGILTRNPSTVGVVLEAGTEVQVTGVMRITRHPVQCGILIWSVSHLVANGDLPSLLFFGAFALISGCGMVLIDRRKRKVFGEGWSAFQDSTSLLPFVAVARGRQSLDLLDIGWLAPLVAAVIFVALWWGHVWVSGVPVGLGW